MNSEYEKNLSEVKRIASQKLTEAEKPTPCFMVTQENWNLLLQGLAMQIQMMESMVTNEEMVSYYNQLAAIFRKEKSWLEEKQQDLKSEMEFQVKNWKLEMEKQAGKLNEQYASALEKTRSELETQARESSEKLYHRILTPCLLTTFLAAVLTLLQIWQV